MRVLVLTPDYPPALGGIQHLLARVVESLEGVETRVVCIAAPGSRSYDSALGHEIRRVPALSRSRKPGKLLVNGLGLAEAAGWRPDVLLSGHIVTSPGAAAAARTLGIPYVQYVYGEEVAAKPRMTAFALRHAAAVIVISRYAHSLLPQDGWDQARVRLVPPGVDLPEVPEHRPTGVPTVITISRLADRYKGHDVMTDAIALVRHRLPRVRWQVIGDGPLRAELERKGRQTGLNGAVRFLGAVDEARKSALLASADVFAMPSRLAPNGGGEGFGIVYLEAGWHGLPVVAGNVGGALDAVLDGETGLLVDPTSPVAVAEAITYLLENPERARAMGEAGRDQAARYSWPAVAGEVRKVLGEVSGVS